MCGEINEGTGENINEKIKDFSLMRLSFFIGLERADERFVVEHCTQ
jgi:hypothetical protein